jgi:hypothetical protein
MFPNFNFFDYVIIISGALVCLKKIAEMDRYHELRVLVLTAILSAVAILFFLGYGLTLGNPVFYDCASQDGHFCQTEM